jgi:hypothetical protein
MPFLYYTALFMGNAIVPPPCGRVIRVRPPHYENVQVTITLPPEGMPRDIDLDPEKVKRCFSPTGEMTGYDPPVLNPQKWLDEFNTAALKIYGAKIEVTYI